MPEREHPTNSSFSELKIMQALLLFIIWKQHALNYFQKRKKSLWAGHNFQGRFLMGSAYFLIGVDIVTVSILQ